ncbi:hypothetical protein C3L33_22827, partial [Rhododendron williamsianum]
GKNFIIKYEGSFKSGKSECLVLEHVEHDRPEGVVHRDVKPGNFLFSVKVNRGYLIDFNLAMDLHLKYGPIDKSMVGYDVSVNCIPLAHAKSLPPTNQKTGVTLLYLMIGRTPFTGEPEQNIKEIARLMGSEDLWEVAKLHNGESSFPVDLLDVQFLPSMKLRDWCKQNTKRPEFLDLIPRSLFDLVDKCLIVNPRQRISAEEALRHEFFSPCHEGL